VLIYTGGGDNGKFDNIIFTVLGSGGDDGDGGDGTTTEQVSFWVEVVNGQTIINEGGTLSYQWYQCNDTNKTNPVALSNSGSIAGSNSEELYVEITRGNGSIVNQYYFCRVTNTRNGSTAQVDSRVATLTYKSV
jgi:hypothetical protein